MYTNNARTANHGLRIGMLVTMDKQAGLGAADVVAKAGKAVVDTVGAVMHPAGRVVGDEDSMSAIRSSLIGARPQLRVEGIKVSIFPIDQPKCRGGEMPLALLSHLCVLNVS